MVQNSTQEQAKANVGRQMTYNLRVRNVAKSWQEHTQEARSFLKRAKNVAIESRLRD